MGRSPCCDKATVKRGPWSEEEDARLRSYIEQHGGAAGSWMALPRKAGLRRCGKSCRLRWLNYLRPGVRHGGFSPEEDRLICALYAAVGSRWSLIAAHLPGRTDNGVKNYWNSRLKKKLAMLLFAGKPTPPHDAAAAAGRNVNASAAPAAAVPPPPPLVPWTDLPYPYTGCGVDQMRVVGAGGGADDNMIAAAVVSQLPADASRYSSEPAATELDEIFRSCIGNTTGGEHSDVSLSSSTEVETSWYHQCQQAGENLLLHQQHTVGVPYLYR